MQVRPLSPDDLDVWHDAFDRGWMHERPWETVPPVEHYRRLFSDGWPGERNEAFAAYDGDRLVGCGYVSIPEETNTDKVEFLIAVPPEHRRQGVGRALTEYAVEQTTEAGATFAITPSSYPFDERETHGHRRFAEALGFKLDMDEVHRMLRLPVDADLLEKLADEASAHHEGYRIETWVDGVPDAYVDSFVDCSNLLAQEAPMGEVPWEAEAQTRESFGEQLTFMRDTGRTRFSSAAISREDEVVAYTELVTRGDGSGKVSQWGTLVRPDHRGHHLGTAVKVANLRRLQEDRPDSTEVHTRNAEVNAAMIAINAILGFEAVAVHPCFYKTLR